MKNILFVVDEQKYGGVSKVLINILNNIDYVDKQIDVLVLHNSGQAFKNKLPKCVNIIYGTKFFNIIDKPLKEIIKSKNILDLINKIKLILYMKTGLILKKLKKERRKILKKEYSTEIAFKDGFTVLFTAVGKSKNKISWLHTDYEIYDCTKNYRKIFTKVYKKYINKIVSITKEVENQFNKIYNCQEKSQVIENLIDDNEILKLSEKENPYDKNKINFVCVGRTVKVKGYDRLLKQILKLKENGILNDEIFNIVGDGEEYKNLQEYVEKVGLNNNVKLLGYKENPYPYIKYADMLLLVSYYEGLGLVLYEALCLKVPCFATKISEIDKTLNNGEYGMIVENSEQGIYNGLEKIIKDKKILYDLKDNANKYMYTKKYDILKEINAILV